MRPLSGIFRISGCLPLDHTCPNAADFHPMQANMCCESKQTTICENIGKRSLSLPDLYSSPSLYFYLRYFSIIVASVQGRKVILRGLGTGGIIWTEPSSFKRQLGGFQLAVVVVAHGEAVRSGVMDHQIDRPYRSSEACGRWRIYRCSRTGNRSHRICGHRAHFPCPAQ